MTHAIPIRLIDALHADVRRYGRLDVETGMFLLGTPNTLKANTLALAGTAGITRERGRFAVTGAALARLFAHARDQQLQVLAQLHSHGGPAFLSRVDLKHGFAVDGFTTCVIPNYRRASRNPAAWGWWQHTAGQWQPCPPYTVNADGAIARVITFDERGVHES
jgi:proteasome lid subunit RPN8/RPN11